MTFVRLTVSFAALVIAAGAIAQDLPAFDDLPAPDPAPPVSGEQFAPPITDAAPPDGAPVISSYTTTARSDETLVLAGENLGEQTLLWGSRANSTEGATVGATTDLAPDASLAFVTVEQREPDGLYLLWPGNEAGHGRPVRVNAPEVWWCTPNRLPRGTEVGVYGRRLTRLPDEAIAHVCLVRPGERFVAIDPRDITGDQHALRFTLPEEIDPGTWQVWVHAGMGGSYGWGGPVELTVTTAGSHTMTDLEAPLDAAGIQAAIDVEAEDGGGLVLLPAGEFELEAGLTVPEGVTVTGAGRGATILRLSRGVKPDLPGRNSVGWGLSPGRIHTQGDELIYRLDVPEAGAYTVWMRYGTEMSPWDVEDMGDHTSLRVEGREPVPLMNLPNTGSFAPTAWSRSATIELPAGEQTLIWRNDTGGGLAIDAFVFARDPDWTPGEADRVEPGDDLLVLHGEDVARMDTREGTLPGSSSALVWLSGDRSGLADLTLLGTGATSCGVLIESADERAWIADASIEGVEIADIAGISGRSPGVAIRSGERVTVTNCDITAHTPILLRGIRQGTLTGNTLTAVGRAGPNALGAITGRTDTVSECVITDNRVESYHGAGGPTVMRMIWLSTGHGSVDNNYIARNEHAPGLRFGGIAGMGQNVGEVILFEANQRMAWHGEIESADARSCTLPQQGPFWPPDSEFESEPALTSYYLQVTEGRGFGQVRRVVGREGNRVLIDRPWRVWPDETSRVLMTNLFARNIVADNTTHNGMTGIQLWIGCWQNVVTGNDIARMRKPGIFLAGFYTTQESTMPNTWNRGVGIMWYNDIDGNRVEDCSAGILLVAYNQAHPAAWPICLGTRIRHNTTVNSRMKAINLASRHPRPEDAPGERPIVGTVCEFNVLRDQAVGVSVPEVARSTKLRRNHLYFWYGWDGDDPPTAYQVEDPNHLAISNNRIEGRGGGPHNVIITRSDQQDATGEQ